MPLHCRYVCVGLLCLLATSAGAAEDTAAEDAAADTAGRRTERKLEGAIGPVLSLAPEYSGASSRKLSGVPGFYLRYGRISISNAGGFVARRSKDTIFRGLGLNLVSDERLRVNLALRVDTGRRSQKSSGLAGIEDVRRTIRMRATATRQFDHGLKLSASWNTDLLRRGGGNVVDAGIGHDRRLSERTTWGVGAGLSWADHRYLQSYYGVTPAESLASGHPVYTPASGLRDITLATGWRMDINDRWVGFWGASVSRLLGPAAASPLTTSPRQWALNGGLAWRF
jgi:outer membrane protein